MTEPELMTERQHIYLTRLALLDAPDPPAAWQHNLAVAEADEHTEKLRRENESATARKFREMRDAL